MKAIAMKMTQEEFDSIKNLLELIEKEDCFKERSYLTNNFRGNLGSISNLNEYETKSHNRKVYEYFDRDIFLKACDIEVDKVWKKEELQFRNTGSSVWYDCLVDGEYRLKPQPDYSKEIESLQNKAKENGIKAIITFEKL